MGEPTCVKPTQISEWVGKETGISEWITVDQERINQFADVTDDHQPIHIDQEIASKTPFGGTIAHGFLTLSLLSQFAVSGGALMVEGISMGVNYGFDKVRFMSPVKSGKRVRGRFTLMDAKERLPGQWSFRYAVKVEIEGETKPALMAEWINLAVIVG